MLFLRSLAEFPPDWHGGAVSIGNFDGVHQGHVSLVKRLVATAVQSACHSIVFTFDPHPATILRPDRAPTPLTWPERKAELLGQLGVDAVIAFPTDRAILELSPLDFFRQVIVSTLAASALVEGPDFCFGKDRAGDLAILAELCRSHRCRLEVVQLQVNDDHAVSSSRIRALIAQGHVEQANQMLLQPYRLRGCVAPGNQRGRTLGFPTANLEMIDTLIPAAGVYAARAYPASEPRHAWPAAVNIGSRPTFHEVKHTVEVHLIGFHGDLYDQILEVDFLHRLRDIQPFKSVDELRSQLHLDVIRAQEMCQRAHA